MRKPTICMGEADQRLCFRYTDSTFPPLLIPKLSRFYLSSVTVQAGLCWTWLKTQIVVFFMHRLNYAITNNQAVRNPSAGHTKYENLGKSILHWSHNTLYLNDC